MVLGNRIAAWLFPPPSVDEPRWRSAVRGFVWKRGSWWWRRWPAEATAALKKIRFHEARRYFGDGERRAFLEALGRSISTGASIVDYHLLHRYILARRPRRILELGSGVTTLIMADALREALREAPDSAPGHIHTLEDVPKYFEDARDLCPEGLRPYVTYHLAPVAIRSFRGLCRTACYENLPEGPFDLVFVDGPNIAGRCLVDGDLLFALAGQAEVPADVILDGRKHTAELFLRVFPGSRCAYDPAMNLLVMRGIAGRDIRERPSRPRRPRLCDAFEFLGV
ncbi:MAG: class I SAM-dependent methyltransferase [Verrucomicrobiae bacterium]|nr:class I SAM-dependent methyltransferase [Verrucomicrobiae bacterium]